MPLVPPCRHPSAYRSTAHPQRTPVHPSAALGKAHRTLIWGNTFGSLLSHSIRTLPSPFFPTLPPSPPFRSFVQVGLCLNLDESPPSILFLKRLESLLLQHNHHTHYNRPETPPPFGRLTDPQSFFQIGVDTSNQLRSLRD